MIAILLLFIAPILARAALYAVSDDPRSWRDADWSSAGLLPVAAETAPARVIIFTGTAIHRATPRVFWAVIAVITEVPNTRKCWNVLRSA